MQAMERLMRGRTTFIIAHRLGTLEDCDLRLEVEHGRVVAMSSTAPDTGRKALILTGEAALGTSHADL